MSLADRAPVNFNVSTRILQKLCVNWFESQFGIQPWFADSRWPHQGEIVDVVLFGDFVEQLVRSKKWPKKNYRLWVLSKTVRDVCVSLFDLPEDHIGLIPRYELFPQAKQENPMPSVKQKYSLVYSGRLSPNKNIEELLFVANYLQNEFHHKVTLKLIGYWDRIGSFEDGFSQFEGYQKKIKNLISNLNWQYNPIIYHPLKPNLWLKKFRGHHNVFISLSRYMMEDFGVSVAQAQAAGWPVILSNWGGHMDVRGSNIIKINSNWLSHPDDSLEFSEGKAYLIAKSIDQFLKEPKSLFLDHKRRKLSKLENTNLSSEQLNSLAKLPNVLKSQNLEELRIKMFKKFNLTESVFQPNKLYQYTRTHQARNFLLEYAECFSQE